MSVAFASWSLLTSNLSLTSSVSFSARVSAIAAAAAAAGVDEACPPAPPASDDEEARSEDDGEGLEPVDVEEPPRVESCPR